MAGETAAKGTGTVLRFKRSERLLHWGLAVPYVVCLVTAAVLIIFYNFSPDRAHRDVVSWAHRGSGVALIVLPILALLGSPGELKLHYANVRQAWGWTLNDLKWLALMGAAAVSKRVRLPDQGKFNAGEKLNFMTVMISYPIFIATGIVMWLPGVAVLSWIIHVALALAVAPVVAGHIYMAVINPSTRKGLPGMVNGHVDRAWAKEHYRQWYVETFGHDEGAADARAADGEGSPAARSDEGLESGPAATRFGAGAHHFGAAARANRAPVGDSHPA
jgi:formate dehydrogenase subunit gamma